MAGAIALFSTRPLGSMAGVNPSLELDVACDGHTFTINRLDGAATTVRRGDTFVVNGKIFPSGTIDQGLTGPGQAGSIGTWVCRGCFYYGFEDIAAGAVPHVMTTQHFLLDSFDGLVTDGTEGGQFVVRPILGGYGAYRGATGVSTEIELEENDSLIDLGDGIQVPAPNIRFTFEIE